LSPAPSSAFIFVPFSSTQHLEISLNFKVEKDIAIKSNHHRSWNMLWHFHCFRKMSFFLSRSLTFFIETLIQTCIQKVFFFFFFSYFPQFEWHYFIVSKQDSHFKCNENVFAFYWVFFLFIFYKAFSSLLVFYTSQSKGRTSQKI
jgi:hypothetical protein